MIPPPETWRAARDERQARVRPPRMDGQMNPVAGLWQIPAANMPSGGGRSFPKPDPSLRYLMISGTADRDRVAVAITSWPSGGEQDRVQRRLDPSHCQTGSRLQPSLPP